MSENILLDNKKDDIKIKDEDEDLDPVDGQFSEVLATLGTFRLQITNIQNQIRTIERTIKKQMKSLKKEVSKGKQKGNRKPSGFAKPSKISKDLSEFMKIEEGKEVARTEVTQYLINYIKDKELTNKENKKIIQPDETLKTLLECGEEEVTYFNIQKYMNKHFVKS
tara:strand:+ start:103 stop:600 length:498 start_codon:yes stop_codon:yes gene_type:complete